MIADGGLLKKDWGYTINNEAISGTPKLIYEFHKKDSVTEVVLVTTTRIMTWKMGTWFYVGSHESTVDGEYAFGYTPPITLDDGSGFSQYDYVAITLEDGTQHVAVISSISGDDITLTKNIGVGDVILNGARIIKIAELNGTVDTPVVADTFPAADAMIITNGKDDVMVYDGDLCTAIPNLVTAVGGGNCSARTVLVRDNKVLLFNTNENGTDYPQRVRWCATGDYEDWTTANDAGFEDLYSDSYHIMAAKALGPSTIIYKEKAIVDMKYVGSADFVYYFTTMLQDVGTTSTYGVVGRGDHHIVLDVEKGFYIYPGGYTIQPIGQEIFDELFGSEGSLNRTYKQSIFTTYIESRHLYVALLPIDTGTTPNIAYMLNTDINSWTKRKFSFDMVGMQEVLLVSGVTWADAEGAWEDSDWFIPWNDVTISVAGYRAFMWGVDYSLTRGVWEYSSEYTSDDSVWDVETQAYIAIETTGWYCTPELVNPEGNIRVDRIKIKGSGTSIYVEYSTDEGETWLEYGTITPGSAIVATSLYKQLVSTRIRFRLSGTDMVLSWMAIYWNKEDEE
jgi:hypothetical protein